VRLRPGCSGIKIVNSGLRNPSDLRWSTVDSSAAFDWRLVMSGSALTFDVEHDHACKKSFHVQL